MKGLVVKMSPAVCDIVPNSFRTVRTLTHNEASDRLVEIRSKRCSRAASPSRTHFVRQGQVMLLFGSCRRSPSGCR